MSESDDPEINPANTKKNPDKSELDLKVIFPKIEGNSPTQDQEYCLVEINGTQRKVRFHDYQEIYNIPGLYEKIFYDKLACQSPALIGRLLESEVSRQGMEFEDLTGLDVGAGNGIRGEMLNEAGVGSVVGVDILPAAAEATMRDRPGVYDAYYPVDLLNPPAPVEKALDARTFNGMTLVAALGFGDIPPSVFATAYNIVENGGFIAFNIKAEFLDDEQTSGFATLIQTMEEEGWFDTSLQVRYVHRLNILGEPLLYNAIVGRKLQDIPAETVSELN